MLTDTERDEVARRLRELEQGVIGALIPTGELAENILRAIDYGHSDAMTPYGCLADLIDPGEPNGHECVPGECLLNVREMRHSTEEEQNEYGAMLEKISVELHPVDRDALLALAEDVDGAADDSGGFEPLAGMLRDIARRIREALGVVE